MAAEAVVSAAVQLLVEKLIVTAREEIRLIRGLNKEVARLTKSLVTIREFLHDASRRQVEEGSVRGWLQDLEDLAYEADDILDDINYEAHSHKVEIRDQMERKVCFCFPLRNPMVFRSTMAHRIKNLNLKLKEVRSVARDLYLEKIFENSAISLPAVDETDSKTFDPIFLGRENDMSKIIEMLVQPNEEVLSVIPITGMGGLGKTTLVQKIFNDPQVTRFKQRIWVCVSDNFNSTVLFKRILEQIDDVREDSREAVLRKLQEKLKDGNYLLVLDDLWNNEISKWENFRNSLLGISSNKGNFCLVTTRSTEVASLVNTVGLHPLNELSPHECWLIIKDKAFANKEVPEDLEIVGKNIASKCGGVPLAANMVGATLKGKGIDDWTSFLQGGFSDFNEGENKVQEVLKISFNRLPSALLKKCFAYLSLFPKDAELEKEWLVQLWMAEGFLGGNGDMESMGNRVYDLLLQNCFLQEPQKDKYGNIMTSKMHDLVHDLACLVSEVESFNVENCKTDKRYPPRLRYLATESLDEEAYKLMQDRRIHLRTLFFGDDELSHGVLKGIKNLHTLDLQESCIEELPNSIGKLTKLRLLNVSSTFIKAFPEDICKLFNMQTLRAVDCELERLPDRLHQLVNLRHLVVDRDADRQMPLQLGNLTSLQTLKFFNVGHENGRRIEELGSLNNLKGELEIFHLDCVNNKEEATRASLGGKPNIYKLEFVWIHSREINSSDSGLTTCKNNDEEVLEGLEPHPNIKSLTVKGFKGDRFPPWVMSMSVIATRNLDKLIEVRLIDCERCEEIPTLGNLPLLEILVLDGLKKVRSLGHSFYYPIGTIESMSRGCTRRQTPPFRSLRSFTLRNMDSLLKWMEAPRTMSADESGADHAFHSLEKLKIMYCREILIVPNHKFPALQTLKISSVKIGSWLVGMISGINASSLTNLEISYVPGVKRVSCNGQRIENLQLEGCPDLQSIQFSSEGGLTSSSLKTFEVSRCEALTDVMLGHDLVYTSLESFQICYCRNVSFSNLEDFEKMLRLRRLDIIGCPELSRLRAFGNNSLSHLTELQFGTNSFNRFCEMLQGIHQLQSLQELTLLGQPHWDYLPNQLQHLSNSATLYFLSLWDFGRVEALPEWLGNLSSLESLKIFNFKSLKEMPSKEAMQSLTKLKRFHIHNSPLIKEIKNPQCHLYHSEWPKISHIKEVEIW